MADIYIPGHIPADYDPQFLAEELRRISASLQELEVPKIILTIVYKEPAKRKEGMIVNADGTYWNPGSGAGLYQYLSSAWVKL